ncbi:MAG: DUF4271 domain-containing protein [Bacteroidaceae bacterium]|nr:DUF4271 domain-containing protein [Bacteroidaceae bacterium]
MTQVEDTLQVIDGAVELLTADTLTEHYTDTVYQHHFSVWRIVQQMQGCTPQQIDSVIQANMPKREIRWSTRPDTLEIPGLHGTRPENMLREMPRPHEMSFFLGKPYWHPELPASQHGRTADPLPYTLRRDDWVTGALLLCLLILVYVIRKTWNQTKLHAKQFFYPPKLRTGPQAEQTSFEANAVYFMLFQLSLLGGLLVFAHSQTTLHLFLGQVSPYYLLGIYVGSFGLYFLVKRVLVGLVNWVFFEKTKQKLYDEACSFLVSVESVLAFPVVLAFVYFDLPFFQVALVLGILLIFAKILLLFKCYSILFGKSYCIFHLFAYLCTLEILPLIALWKALLFVTDYLIIKY